MPEKNVTPGKFKGKFRGIYVLWAIVVLFALIAVISSFYTVDQTEQAVVLRLGKYYKTEMPGLHGKIPFGIDKVYKVPTEIVHTVEFGFRTIQPGINTVYSSEDFSHESTMLTGDLNIVDVTWTIQFRITDPKAWLFNVEDSRVYNSVTRESTDNRIQTIRDISQSTINMLVGDRAYFDVIGSERTNIETQALDLIDDTLKIFGLGVKVVNVKLQNIVPPKGDVQAAFEDVNMAYQDMERMINEGKESYNKEIPKAKGVAKQMLEEAEGYRIARINNAEGDVALFEAINKEYQRSRQVTRQRLYYEMIEDVFSDSGNTDIVDKNLENFLPLKNVGPADTTRGTR